MSLPHKVTLTNFRHLSMYFKWVLIIACKWVIRCNANEKYTIPHKITLSNFRHLSMYFKWVLIIACKWVIRCNSLHNYYFLLTDGTGNQVGLIFVNLNATSTINECSWFSMDGTFKVIPRQAASSHLPWWNDDDRKMTLFYLRFRKKHVRPSQRFQSNEAKWPLTPHMEAQPIRNKQNSNGPIRNKHSKK